MQKYLLSLFIFSFSLAQEPPIITTGPLVTEMSKQAVSLLNKDQQKEYKWIKTRKVDLNSKTQEILLEVELLLGKTTEIWSLSVMDTGNKTLSLKLIEKKLLEKKVKQKPKSLDELFLFFPSKYPRGNWQPNGLKFEDVWFTTKDGTKIHAWYCPVENAKGVVLYCHGNAGNITNRARTIKRLQQKLALTFLIFDYRGYGRSEGSPSVEGILQDAQAAHQFLVKKANVSETDIIFWGRSLGGSVAAQLLAKFNPRAIVLEGTFSSFRDIAAKFYPRLAWLVPAEKLNSVSRISQYQGPVLICHGDQDEIIPYDLGTKLFKAANEPKTFVRIPGGTHNEGHTEFFYKEALKFITQLPR